MDYIVQCDTCEPNGDYSGTMRLGTMKCLDCGSPAHIRIQDEERAR
jgi:hypothetical protein